MIASQQVLANALPLLQLRPQAAVVFCSEHPSARESWCRLRGLRRSLPETRIERRALPASTAYADLFAFAQEQAAQLQQDWPDHRLLLNATGGTKLMALAFVQALQVVPNAAVIYCDTAADRIDAVAPAGSAGVALAPDLLDLRRYLVLQGHAARRADTSGPALSEGLRAAAGRVALAGRLLGIGSAEGDGFAPDLVARLRGRCASVKDREAWSGQPRQLQALQALSAGLQSAALGRLKLDAGPDGQDGLRVEYVPADPTPGSGRQAEVSRFLGGAYLEWWVADLAHRCLAERGIGPEHLGMNVTIEFRPGALPQAQSAPAEGRNELDVVLVWRNRMLIIECKAGLSSLHKNKDSGQHALNKLRQLRDAVGGPMAEAWLLSQNPVGEDSALAIRARDYGIRLFHGRQGLAALQPALEAWLGAAVPATKTPTD